MPASNPVRLARRLIAMLPLLVFVGCETVHYDFRPPATDVGRLCITQCAAIKETCTGNEMRRVQNDKATCERSNDVALRACMSKAANKDQQKDCSKNKRYCSDYVNTDRCERDYRSCFVNCGGTIQEYRQ